MMSRFLALWVVLCSGYAFAAEPEQFRANYAADGAITGGAFVLSALFSLIDVDTQSQWDSELLPIDERVKLNFSAKAAARSDALALGVIVMPLAAQLGLGTNEQLAQFTLLYGEALGINFLLNSASKYLVQRPRPYTYNPDPRVQAFAETQGYDSHLSFYSGHASTSFAAGVAGSYLFALSSPDKTARACLWGVELALATATTNLRVRAGKHFYSDVLLGALVGSAIGVVVPLVHQRDGVRYRPSSREWWAMGGGIALGGLISQLMPLPNDVTSLLDAAPIALSPLVLERGAGLALAGGF